MFSLLFHIIQQPYKRGFIAFDPHHLFLLCTKLEFLDPVKVRYKYWPEVKEKIHSERSFEDTVAVLSHLLKVKWTKETFVHKPSKEGLTCLLCSFGVSLAATSFNALVRPRKLHRRVSGHLQRCPATWKCNKIIGKHFKKGWKKWRVIRMKKCLEFGQHVLLAVYFSSQLWLSCEEALPWLLFWISHWQNHQWTVPASSVFDIFKRS